MKFRIEIDCDNAAFESNPNIEIFRILGHIRHNLDYNYLSFDPKTPELTLKDINGNTVGKAVCIK